jgi:hypothetical protein
MLGYSSIIPFFKNLTFVPPQLHYIAEQYATITIIAWIKFNDLDILSGLIFFWQLQENCLWQVLFICWESSSQPFDGTLFYFILFYLRGLYHITSN